MKKYCFLLLTATMICTYAGDGGNEKGGKTGKEENKKAAFSVQLFCPQPELLYKQRGEFPFTYFWRKDFIDIRRFEKVLLKPLNIDKFDFSEGERNNPVIREKVKKISAILQEEFRRAVETEGKLMELKLVDKADDKTMIVEVALVPVMSLDGYQRLMSYQRHNRDADKDSLYTMMRHNLVAIEAVVRSGEDGELIAQAASLGRGFKDGAAGEKKGWENLIREEWTDWSLKFISVIKAELNRDKDGTYLLISGKIQAEPDREDKEKK